MKYSSLGARLAISTLCVVVINCLICVVAAWKVANTWIYRAAADEAQRQANFVTRQLGTIDQLSKAEVASGMNILVEQGELRGAPSLRGTADVAGRTLPALYLGNESQMQSYALVDRVKQLAGGTATLFVWDGANFYRVATNVTKPDGSRAVGTVLDPQGKAFAALTQGRPFMGVVNILGVPYYTSYVPMRSASGTLVGAWYTGYRLDSIAALGQSIAEAAILDRGFVALLGPSGKAVFHGAQISDGSLATLLDNPSGWIVHRDTFPGWDYTVLTAYPNIDVLKTELKIIALPAAGTVTMVGLIMIVQFLMLRRLVVRPVKRLSHHLSTADLNTLLAVERDDEIGELATNFNGYVRKLRHTLFRVRDESAATTGKSDEIRGISEGAVARMFEQRVRAEDAAEAVDRLSREIAGISEHTLDAAGRAHEATEAAHSGTELVSSSVDLMQTLSEETQQSASRVASLSARAEQIGAIVDVINEIAAGTNLLALNASIEAARAGEHGRGFAVVAGEVRRLAERTAQATQQVASLVSGIKNETAQTADGIRAACERAAEGAEAVSRLNATFKEIAELVVEVNSRVNKIADAARQETTAAESVRNTMRDVAAISQENAGGAEQIMAATGKLQETANVLQEMVQEFELKELPEDVEALPHRQAA